MYLRLYNSLIFFKNTTGVASEMETSPRSLNSSDHGAKKRAMARARGNFRVFEKTTRKTIKNGFLSISS